MSCPRANRGMRAKSPKMDIVDIKTQTNNQDLSHYDNYSQDHIRYDVIIRYRVYPTNNPQQNKKICRQPHV